MTLTLFESDKSFSLCTGIKLEICTFLCTAITPELRGD